MSNLEAHEEFLQISSQRKREMGDTEARAVCQVDPGVPTLFNRGPQREGKREEGSSTVRTNSGQEFS